MGNVNKIASSVALVLVSAATLLGQRHSAGGFSPGFFGAHPSSIGIPASAYSIGIPASAYSVGIPPSPFRTGPGAVPYGAKFSGVPGASYQRGAGYRGKGNFRRSYGFVGAPFFPFFGAPSSDNFYSYDEPPIPAEGDAPPMYDNGLGEQIRQLSAQVNDLQRALDQQTEKGEAPPEPPAPPARPITLVLNSGKALQVQSYAVMGDAFWDLSNQPFRKIPLSSVDIPASMKASEANGAEFPTILGKPSS